MPDAINLPSTRFVIPVSLSIGITVLSGAAVGIWTAQDVDAWYATLQRPFFAPPNAVFGPVWTVLYVLMGLAAGRIWVLAPSVQARSRSMWLYGTQLVLNLAWSVIFFKLHALGWALAEMALLLILIAACARAFHRISPLSGWLMAPYFAWVCFALALNAAFAQLNT